MKTIDVNRWFFYAFKFETKTSLTGLKHMKKPIKQDENLPVEGQDFADPKEELNEKPSSHGEVANQKGSDFSELEESRMEHPPKHREENDSSKDDLDSTPSIDQSKGVK
ncbi:hypothetical protein DU508_10035 [Pedobacter chinensis]|uniref:Uncharacterized protein n=1 Tax=Pedobacter chinensis TaxID=2282421 RepID=A0A369Q3H5_9SPHI|nr:hypothetical protein [Pedobacter chinensis]RDC57479.1 hypothetical protein DU508_10035 [Pedobacter chinensis]